MPGDAGSSRPASCSDRSSRCTRQADPLRRRKPDQTVDGGAATVAKNAKSLTTSKKTAYADGGSPFLIWSGVVYAAPFLVSACMQPLWGILGDRIGRKPMIVRAMLGLSIANVLMGFSQSAPQFLIFRLLQSCLSGFLAPSLALVASSTPADKTGYALGTLQTALISSLILGPFLGGVLIHFMGCRPISLFDRFFLSLRSDRGSLFCQGKL